MIGETPRGVFVTGTDTEIGKTRVCCLIVRAMVECGYRPAVMKPVASGCIPTDEGLRSEDALQLMSAAETDLEYSQINPYAFEPAISPHIAARQAGLDIDLQTIKSSYLKLAEEYALTVVEGVGGWYAPLTDRETVSDLACVLDLPVVLVVGMRLGCLNHAILSERAILETSLPLAGWVANCLQPDMPYLEENLRTLKSGLRAGCLGVVPYLRSSNASTSAGHEIADALMNVL